MSKGSRWRHLLDGYESVRMPSGQELILDSSTANEVRAEMGRIHQELISVRKAEDDREHQKRIRAIEKAKRRASAETRQKKMNLTAVPPKGWHAVLPSLPAIAKGLEDGQGERSADSDVNKRRRQLCEKLVTLGPNRRVGMPTDWASRVDELEAALPHFKEPIRSLKNALALAQATGAAPRLTPQLMLGPPGVGKTFFTHKVAELLGTPQASLQFDQPTAGAGLRGSDKYWSNTEAGLLFNLICLGEFANPVLLLDEMDKAVDGSSRVGRLDALAQLHGALEPETARRIVDISVDIEFDASLVVYVGTANTHMGIGAPILSRMEVHGIQAPGRAESVTIADAIVQSTLQRLDLVGKVSFDKQALHVLGQMSPRLMTRATEKAVAAAVVERRSRVGEWELWREISTGDRSLH